MSRGAGAGLLMALLWAQAAGPLPLRLVSRQVARLSVVVALAGRRQRTMPGTKLW